MSTGPIPVNFRKAMESFETVPGAWIKTEKDDYYFYEGCIDNVNISCSVSLTQEDFMLSCSCHIIIYQFPKRGEENSHKIDTIEFTLKASKLFFEGDEIWENNNLKYNWYTDRVKNLIVGANNYMILLGDN